MYNSPPPACRAFALPFFSIQEEKKPLNKVPSQLKGPSAVDSLLNAYGESGVL